ncbi:MAG TPA: hypothetical protein VIF34_11175, partial [Methylocystis sp.]
MQTFAISSRMDRSSAAKVRIYDLVAFVADEISEPADIVAQSIGDLGSVGNRDSSFQLVMIQALDEPIRFDRRPMGEDGAALSWQGERSRP